MKQYITVIFWMRAIACINIVLIHSLTSNFAEINSGQLDLFYKFFQLLLMFSTPLFIFISEFLIAKNYNINLPNNFLKKRFKFLGLPFILINIVLVITYSKYNSLWDFILSYLKVTFMADSLTYFIVVILQFFVLHFLFCKWLIKLQPIPVIIVSLIITTLYLAIPKFIEMPDSGYLQIIWNREGWLIIFGWLSYFVLGFYLGIYYDKVMDKIQNYKYLIISGFILSITIVSINYFSGFSTYVASKRMDMPFYTTMIILLFLLIFSYIKHVPKFILFISNYSFNIYLIHYFIVHQLGNLSNTPHLNVLYKLILTITISIGIAYIINLSSFGKYLIGNTYKVRHDDILKSKNSNQLI